MPSIDQVMSVIALSAAALVVCASYAPLLSMAPPGREFLSWDDQINFVQREWTVENALSARILGVYEPVANMFKLAIVRISAGYGGKLRVEPFLVASVTLHIANTLLAASLAAKITALTLLKEGKQSSVFSSRNAAAVISSTVAVLLVGVHPLHTEVVAWASCFPYALATCFALCAAHCDQDAKTISAGVLLMLAAFSKAATLPVFLVLLVSIRSGKSRFQRTFHELFMYSISVIAGLCGAIWANEHGGARNLDMTLGISERIVKAAKGFWWYPGRFLRPWLPFNIQYEVGDLSFTTSNTNTLIVFCTVCIIGVSAVYLFRSKHESVLTDLSSMVVQYALLLAPVSGIVTHGHLSLAADRYAYIPSCLVFVPGITSLIFHLAQWKHFNLQVSKTIGQGNNRMLRRRASCIRAAFLILIISLCVPLAELTRFQMEHWRDDVRLWTYVLQNTKEDSITRGEVTLNLASGLSRAGYTQEAIAIFQKLLNADETTEKDNSEYESPNAFLSKSAAAHAHHAYGNALLNHNLDAIIDVNELAKEQYKTAIRLDPLLTEPVASLARMYHEMGSEKISNSNNHGGILSIEERKHGITLLELALKLYTKARKVAEFGATEEGLKQRRLTGSRVEPSTILSNGPFWLAYGMCYLEHEKHLRFFPHAEREPADIENTIRIGLDIDDEPIVVDTHAFFVRAVELDPSIAEAHYQVAKAIKDKGGDADKILYHYQQCIALDPKHVHALFGMANYLQSQGNMDSAILNYRKAIAIEPDATDLRINLALALRLAGQSEESLKEAKEILEIDNFHSKATRLVEVLTSKNGVE